MQKLSEDLLHVVFINALPSDLTVAIPAPLNFALVCHNWRELVLSRPALWASLKIKDHAVQGRSAESIRVCGLVKAWLRRSASVPLQIHLDIVYDIKKSQPKSVRELPNQVFQLLAQERHRWGDVEVHFSSDCLRFFAPTIEISSSPPLTDLVLEFRGNRGWSTIACIDLSSSIVGAPPCALRRLALGPRTVMRLPKRTETLHLPHLDLLSFMTQRHSDLVDTFRILSASPNISCLSLCDVPAILPPPPLKDPIVTLSNLTHLILHSQVPNTALRFLTSLTCPSLQIFKLYAVVRPKDADTSLHINDFDPENKEGYIATEHLLRFFERNNPPLTRLEMRYASWHPNVTHEHVKTSLGDLLDFLGTRLKHLILHGPILDDSTIRLLTDGSATTISTYGHEAASSSSAGAQIATLTSPNRLLCPSLSRLRLSHSPPQRRRALPVEIDKEAVEEMILSRWKNGRGALKKVTLQLPSFDTFLEGRTRMKTCVEEGLKMICEREANVFA